MEEPPATTAVPKTTTISTIAVQSGNTRIVIALLQSREWLELRVVEMTPGLCQLGSNLSEATQMLAAHNLVIEKIHSKQSPVEELLRQADVLIASQHTRAEVYAAMAESLSLAWQDVNTLLQRRREILQLNVKYHNDAAVCLERTGALEAACSGAGESLPVEVSALRDLLTHLADMKRAMLEALMAALQDGRALLDTLRQIAHEGSLDSRPGHITVSTEAAISQVERWLEDLHDRRRSLELSWQSRKTELEQCLALALLTTDLRLLEEIYAERMESLSRNCAELGDSEASAQLLSDEHCKLIPEAKELQEQGLKILRATEQLAATGHFAGEEATAQAYQLLNTSTEYLDLLDRRQNNLNDAKAFFNYAQVTISRLEKLIKELSTLTAQELAQIPEVLTETCAPVLKQGYQLLEAVPGAKGVQNTIDALENLKLKLNLECTAIQEDSLKINQSVDNFLEKQNQLYSWLVFTSDSFLQGHQDMGSVLAVAKDFLQHHHKILNDLQTKGTEINALLSSVPDLVTSLDEERRVNVEQKAEALRDKWSWLKQILEKRTELSSLYVKFHTIIVELATQIDSLSERLSGQPQESENRELEEQLCNVTQLFAQMNNVADNFNQDASRAGLGEELVVCVERARLCVDTLREHFAHRVDVARAAWQEHQLRLDQSRVTAQRWTNTMTDANQTMDWVGKLDAQLYPVLNETLTSAKAVIRDLEGKRDQVVTEIKRAQSEVQLRISTAEEILLHGEVQNGDDGVLGQLKNLQERLQQIITDYQVLLEMFISFFKNLSELEHTVEGLESQYKVASEPSTLPDVDKLLREHDASRQAILELFKFAHTESQQIINKVRTQEPEAAGEKDVDSVRRMLESQRTAWERAWAHHRMSLESQQQLSQFNADLKHIHSSIDELSQQLCKIKGQFGDSLATAKANSLAFHYFEKTIELLEQRIETFMGSGDALLKSKHSSSPHIQQELISLRTRWHQFHLQVTDTRQLIDISMEYFVLVDEAEEWFREGSRLLMTIAKKSSTIRTPQEANDLLQEIELFLKPGEAKQDERIQRITDLAIKLFGGSQPGQLDQVKTESKEMIDSFSQVSIELQQIINFLNKPPEEQRMEIVGFQEALPIEESPRKSPSPPLKKVKVEPEELPPNFSLPLHDATIDEGSRFTFECRVTGYPKPEVCWLKDNISIDKNLDYHTKVEEDGLCSLTIDETFTEDSACFTCRATNHLGFAETTALLSVRENERESPPVFVRLLASVVSKEGLPCSLVCKVEGTPLPTVQWFKDGACVDSDAEYVTTYNNGEAVLSIQQLNKNHQGQFSCKAGNRLGTVTTTASLLVQPMISEKAPVFVTSLSNVMARAGEKIKLECEVSGVPEPTVEWCYNGKPLPDTRNIQVQNDKGKIALTIPEAWPKDAGTYSIVAANTGGEITSSCTVTVKGRLANETSDSELASDWEPVKPSIPMVLKDTTVMEGEKVRLDCIIVGQPEPEVIWYHEGVPIKESKEVQLQFQGDRCSLVIAESLPEDAGLYKIVAINSAGEASSSCQLVVHKSGAQSEPSIEELTGTKPLFISLLTDALATEGDTITLECAVTGDPTPSVAWSLNNLPVHASERVKMEHAPDGLCTLVISPVTADDKGVYTARATNRMGEAKCFSHLIVKSAANLATSASASDVRLEDRASVPAFTELFADRAVYDGDSTKFECIVVGKPTPKVKWLYNGEPVSGKDFLPSLSGSRQVLTIPNVTKALSNGQITCTAENEAGKVSCSATLTVNEAPSVDDLMSSIDNLNMSEMSVFEVKQEVMMQSTSHTKFGDGEPKVQIHGMASKTEQVSQKIGDQPMIQKESHKSSEYHSVDGVEQKMDSVSSVQSSGVETGAVVPVVKISQRKPAPPRFITPVQGKIVDQGADVTLECILEGVPSPTVSWRKNSKDLVDSEKVSISWELNKAQCKLSGVTVEDAGKYCCTAVNEAGSASCTADLVVKKNIFPPVFGRRLRADTVEVGKRTALEVEVTGTPDPDITWFKDGNKIAGSSSMYRILAQGSCHRLIIEQAELSHSGRYEVCARNAGGEARSTADLLIVQAPDITSLQPTGFEMDFPALGDFSSSKHTVSVTESFKSDKKVSIHVEQTTIPSDPLLDFPTFSPKPAVPVSVMMEQVENKEEKTIHLEPTKASVPQPTIPETPAQLEERVIEDSSITKKSALSFFKNIIKENEEEDKKVIKPIEPIMKPCIPEPLPAIEPLPILPPLYFDNNLPQPASFSQTSVLQESSQRYESISSSDGFFLQPEPPPEMGFIPKSQVSKTKEEMSDRVKKLEESHRNLSQEQIPSGGVRIFPTPVKKSETISTQTSVQEVKKYEPPTTLPKFEELIPSGGYELFTTPIESKSETITSQKSFQEIQRQEPSFIPPKVDSSIYPEQIVETSVPYVPIPDSQTFITPFKVAKFEPSQNFQSFESKQTMESSFQSSFQSETINGHTFDLPKFDAPKFDLGGPILRPSAATELRPQSPRPSAEGVNMEKLWSSKTKDEYVPFPHSSPTKDILTPPQQKETVQQFKSEKTSKKFQEIRRTSSPLPSVTGLAMEKLWTPSLDQRPLSALSIGERSKSPSVQGLAMDKLWAHKSSNQKKIWPPPPPEEDNRIIPPWQNKSGEDNQEEKLINKPKSEPQHTVKHIETHSMTKMESSKTESKVVSSNSVKNVTAFKEVKPAPKPVQFNIPPQNIHPESKIIYVAEAQASHTTNVPLVEPQEFSKTETTKFSNFSETFEKKETFINGSSIVEEKVLKPSEAIKKWPPEPKIEQEMISSGSSGTDIRSSFLKKEFSSVESKSAFSSTNGFDNVVLKPGPPPEIAFAQPPPRRQSYVEVIEQNLEKNMDKVPSKHLAGAVRIIPPPLKKEKVTKTQSSSSTMNSQTISSKESVEQKQQYVPECLTKPLPNLEPFPYKPDPPQSKPAKCPPPPKPSKFIKGSFTESDYESDCDAVRIGVKWNPWQSDSEDYGFRKVKAPTASSPTKRPHSVTGHAVPPTEFEKPAPLQGPSKLTPLAPIHKPEVQKTVPSAQIQKSEISKSSKSKIIKTEETHQKMIVSKEVKSAQNKSPVLKPGSPPQFVEAPAPKHRPTGKPGSPKTKPKNIQPKPADGYAADTDEPAQQFKMSSKSEELSTFVKNEQLLSYEQTRSEQKTISSISSRTAKKESIKSETQSTVQKKVEAPLEPFPFKPEPVRPTKRAIGPPPPSPSKFIKGQFHESDYESEYEGKIRPIWRPNDPADDLSFRPVKPLLTPVSGKTQNNTGRTPTPPTAFDEPPNFTGPPRPKFEPIDKPRPSSKVKEFFSEKTKLIRPTPVQAQPQIPPQMETIYATPASKPIVDFILKPGSPPTMDFAPPPGIVEKSNIVNFAESTENSKRIVSVQQTTRVMNFGSSSQKIVRKKENIPPPKKVPAFSKESDCESDIDGVVRVPHFDAESKRLKRVEEMKKKFLDDEVHLQPGEPPEYAYSPDPSKMAYSAASKQMSEMTQTFKGKTQKFVSEVMSDIKQNQLKTNKEKPLLKPSGEEPQTYRDESRVSEFGKKQIDPDTGLIYFKYDFGYEFGIVLPGEQKPGAPRKIVSGPSKKEEGAVDFPIIHETSQKKKQAKEKSVKWDPTSESEMSEIESERVKKKVVPLRQNGRTRSPLSSVSPGCTPISPYTPLGHDLTASPSSPWGGGENSNNIVRAVSPLELIKRAPLFITPLRDIACVVGQPARFECIVLAEPPPTISWSKDGSEIHQTADFQMEYRNGVCRLVLPQTRPFDAGQYSCCAVNSLGRSQTSASLQVPGERRSLYK